jgi:hypothetical protein
VLGHFAVVLQCLLAGGLGVGARERDVADLQQFRGGEEEMSPRKLAIQMIRYTAI